MGGQEKRELVESLLSKTFQNANQLYMPYKKFLRQAALEDLKAVGLDRKVKLGKLKSTLGQAPGVYTFYNKSSKVYILAASLEDIFLTDVINKPGRSIKELCQHSPLKIDEAIEIANNLLEEGIFKVKIVKKSGEPAPIIYPVERGPLPAGQTEAVAVQEPIQEEDEDRLIRSFKKAYDRVGQGRHYVFIFEIRRELGWSREGFDHLLVKMMEEGHVAGHPGNPAELLEDEVKDSFQDELGELFVTVTWRDQS